LLRNYFRAKPRLLSAVIVMALALPTCARAQGLEPDAPLGDVARSYRKEKKVPDRAVIDNENLSQIMDEIQNKKLGASLLFSFDSLGKNLEVSSPDVTCSLSFSGKAASLLADPYVPRELPAAELAKLDGPASFDGSSLHLSLFNGSTWKVKEITVGVTIIHRAPAVFGPVLLQPAAERVVETPEKFSDKTVLYHLKGDASPRATTDFAEDSNLELGPDQEWHWAIVAAKGVPPTAPLKADTIPFPGDQESATPGVASVPPEQLSSESAEQQPATGVAKLPK
jgi:hypothetical protein